MNTRMIMLAAFIVAGAQGCAKDAANVSSSPLKYGNAQAIVARELLSMGQVRARTPNYQQQGKPGNYATLPRDEQRRWDLEIVELEALNYPSPVKLEDDSIWYPAGFVQPANCGAVSSMSLSEFERCVLDPKLLDYSNPEHEKRAAEYLDAALQTSDSEGVSVYQYAVTATDCASCNIRQNVSCVANNNTSNWACNLSGSWSWSGVKLNSGCVFRLQTSIQTCGVQTVNQGNPWDERSRSCKSCNYTSPCDSSGGQKTITYAPDGSGAIASCVASPTGTGCGGC